MDETRKGEQVGPAPPLHLDPGLLILVETGDHPPIAQIGKDLPDLFHVAFLIVKDEFMPEEAFEKGVVIADPIDRGPYPPSSSGPTVATKLTGRK